MRLAQRRANAFPPEATIPRHPVEFLRSLLPSAARARSRPSRSASDLADGCAMLFEPGIERDIEADRACRSAWLKQGIYARRAGKPIGRSYAGLV